MYSVLHVITSSAWGGLELYVASLIKEQAAAGQSCAAYVLPESRIAKELTSAGIRVFHAERCSHFNLTDIRRIRNIVHTEGFSVVHSHTSIDVWPSTLAVLGTKTAHVFSVYVVAMPKRDPHHWFIYRRIDAVISSSQHTNDRLLRAFPISSKKFHLVRYGRNWERFVISTSVRREVRAQLHIADDEVAFGVVGRLDPQKGIREFAESLLELSPSVREKVKYFIIGARPDADQDMNQWLAEFQRQPEIEGRLTVLPFQEDIVPYFNALDSLVLSSYREMYSLSVIEAMSMKLPVIGTDREGTPEQLGLKEGNSIVAERGLLVEPQSPKAIAEGVELYVQNPAMRMTHGEAAYNWVRREHDMQRAIDDVNRVYSITVGRRTAEPDDSSLSLVIPRSSTNA